MGLQYIQDQEGNTTGVIIPIDEWQCLKNKYAELKQIDVDQSSKLDSKRQKATDKDLIVGYTATGKPITKEEYNLRIKNAEHQLTSGETISQEDLEKEVSRW